jgi:3-methyladenine DNA glycosylase/8-oxoguanine DNA glycosylase
VLGRVSTAVGPWQLELETTRSLFAALLRAISYQQLHARAAEAIHGRVNALFPGSPSPAALRRLSDESLRGAGLSAAKLLALRDLAAKAEAGIGPNLAQARRLSAEVLIERLTAVRGSAHGQCPAAPLPARPARRATGRRFRDPPRLLASGSKRP